LDDVLRRTRWTGDAIWPTQLPHGLITLDVIDQVCDIDLHRWTPVRGRRMGWHQYIPSLHSTTLESNMSDPNNAHSLRLIRSFHNETICSPLHLPQMPAVRGVSGWDTRRQVYNPRQCLCQHSSWTHHFSTLLHSPRTLCRLALLPLHNRPSRCL